MMKIRLLYIILFCFFCMGTLQAQNDPGGFKNWFNNNIRVAHSMQTVDLSEQPAQLQITLPQHGVHSYLVNVAVAAIINRNTVQNFISNVNVEYHRNTLTDAEQNNFSIGYGYKWRFINGRNTDYFMTGDVQYVYDGVHINNSIAGTFLFTLFRAGKRLNWNTNNFRLSNRLLFNLAPFVGFQVQDVFKAPEKGNEGFILRPEFAINTLLAWNKKAGPPFDKIMAVFCNYTGRNDIINGTAMNENYTQLLQTGVNYYLAYTPFEISLGASFNSGSNPLYGLAKQQYWLISVNFLK